jgi:Protein of unknown function (DUF2917)
MASRNIAQTQQSTNPLQAGAWKLGGGRAMTLHPRDAGLLRIARGRLWATFDGPHTGPANDWGDRVLVAGSRLALRAGQRVVVEAWSREAPVYFTWDSMP